MFSDHRLFRPLNLYFLSKTLLRVKRASFSDLSLIVPDAAITKLSSKIVSCSELLCLWSVSSLVLHA